MSARQYRRRPAVIEAMLVTSDPVELYEVVWWIRANGGKLASLRRSSGAFRLITLEGEVDVNVGDYVVRGVKGEFYPCRADVFEATHEAVTA